MSLPMKFAETKNELVKSLRKSAKDNLRMTNLKKPIAMTLGERYALIAEIENNIADRIDAMWKREQKRKPRRNCDVGSAEEQTERFKDLCRKYRRGPGPRANCKGCPIQHESLHVGCTFAWAQKPYMGGGIK